MTLIDRVDYPDLKNQKDGDRPNKGMTRVYERCSYCWNLNHFCCSIMTFVTEECFSAFLYGEVQHLNNGDVKE